MSTSLLSCQKPHSLVKIIPLSVYSKYTSYLQPLLKPNNLKSFAMYFTAMPLKKRETVQMRLSLFGPSVLSQTESPTYLLTLLLVMTIIWQCNKVDSVRFISTTHQVTWSKCAPTPL